MILKFEKKMNLLKSDVEGQCALQWTMRLPCHYSWTRVWLPCVNTCYTRTTNIKGWSFCDLMFGVVSSVLSQSSSFFPQRKTFIGDQPRLQLDKKIKTHSHAHLNMLYWVWILSIPPKKEGLQEKKQKVKSWYWEAVR